MNYITTQKVRNFFTLLFLLSIFTTLSAQEDFSQTIKNYFLKSDSYLKEKAYVHTDKPFYAAGENIWFRGYVLNGVTHRDNTPSNYLYVELINRKDSVVTRQKVRRTADGFVGNIPLPPSIVAGDYYLRAYTGWMQNWDKDYFYMKNIRIDNPIANSISSDVKFSDEGEKLKLANIIVKEGPTPLGNKEFLVTVYSKGEKKETKKIKSQDNGSFSISLDALKGNYEDSYLDITLVDPVYVFNTTYSIPALNKDFAVTFFPEGGALLDGVMQNVAFKAQGSDGFAVEVEGNVFDGDENIATFTTSHDGMGAFSLLVDKDAKYEVEVTSKDGVTKRFAMPAVETKGAALSLAQRRDNIFYKINLGSETTSIDGLYLIIQARGKMLFATPLNEQILSGDLSSQSLPNGVVHFIVADAATKKPVTERLMFINNDPKTDVGFECSLNSFARRERVELTVDLKDMNGEPLSGDFSVSITDNSTVTPDSLAENILSSVLLSSELKGYIDNPGYYLQSGNAKVRRDADLLMMTHGWRKYMDFDFSKMPVEPDQYYVENGQYISGVVKNGIGSLVKNSDIVIFATKNRMFRIAETNDKGEFLVDGLEYPDSTEFVIQANRNKGLNLSDLVIYPEVYPFAKPLNRNLYSVHNNVEKDDYLFNSRERYYYEGGMKVFNLRDVEVEGKKNASSKESVYSRSADYSFTSDKIEERQFMRLFDMISELPGVYSETGQDLMIRGAMASPAIVINDIVYDYVDGIDLINYMDISDVARIDILRVPNSTALGIQGGNGAVVITTKSGKAYTPERSSNITTFMPMGYSRAAEFYIPVYDSPLKKADNTPDLRTTIHWVPSLKVDSTGVATIIYYCHDNPKRFRIEMEGISGNGEVVRFTKVY